jgi:peptidyl-prolyl cis-trans isomerase B (cyclophilin B)
MNKSILSLFLFVSLLSACAQNSKKEQVVTIKTKFGDMVAILYDETPKHKANFLKLAKSKYYDSLLFHRVISEFMIQGGDPDSKKAVAGQPLGRGGPGYTIDAEFNPKFFHEKGALSAARLPDGMNPTKASSGSQFYVVQGKKIPTEELTQLELNLNNQRKGAILREIIMMPKNESLRSLIGQKQQAQDGQWLNSFFEKSDTLIAKEKPDYKSFAFTPQQKETYSTIGGAPFLDGDYTVFGKVIKGLEVIDKIAEQKGPADRPTEDIRMFVTVEEMSRKKIEKEFGYTFPAEPPAVKK